jgi:hypothetical protein
MQIDKAGSRPSDEGSLEQFTSAVQRDTLFKAEPTGRVQGGMNTIEPGAQRLAHPTTRADLDRDCVLWKGAALEWSNRGDTAWRRGLVSGRGAALAWRDADHSDVVYRNHRSARRQGCRVGGACQRRSISDVRPVFTAARHAMGNGT